MSNRLIGFDQGGVLAINKNRVKSRHSATFQRRLDDRLADAQSVLEWIPAGEHAAIRNYTSTTDLSSFLQAAIDAAEAGGFSLRVPSGRYRFGTTLTIQASSVKLIGEGDGTAFGTQFEYTSLTGNAFAINSASAHSAGILNCRISCTVRNTTGYAIEVSGGAFRTVLRDIRIDWFGNGILVEGATDADITRVHTRFLLGTSGIRYGGTANAAFRLSVTDFIADNPYPLPYGPAKLWAQSTAFNANDIIANNGNIYQCSTSGTSAAVGTGPAGFPSGTTPESAFTNTITDGTAQWKFVCSAVLGWIVQDSNAHSLALQRCACINGAFGYLQTDTLNTGSSYPLWTFADDLTSDHAFTFAFWLHRGEGFYAGNCWIGSCLGSNGVTIASTHRGEISITNTRIVANAWHGVIVEGAGPVDVQLHGNIIGDNGQALANTFDGVNIAAGVTRFQIVGNRIGDTVGTGGNPQRFAIFIAAGATDNYVVVGNGLSGNTSGGLSDGATGTNKAVGPNVGHRFGGWSAATGTATRTTFATGTVTTAQLAERVKALIDDLIAHGVIGA